MERLPKFSRRPTKLVKRFMKLTLLLALLICACAVDVHAQGRAQDDKRDVLAPPVYKKDLYPADANAKQEISAALDRATKAQQRVLLIFGGNWCSDCHVLDRALHDGESGAPVKLRYVLVL